MRIVFCALPALVAGLFSSVLGEPALSAIIGAAVFGFGWYVTAPKPWMGEK